MTNWRDQLSPRDREEWERFVRSVREDAIIKMGESAFVISLVPASGEADIKFAVELGLAIMLDKPLLVVVPEGVTISRHLQRVADQVVVADLDTEAGQAKIGAALRSFTG